MEPKSTIHFPQDNLRAPQLQKRARGDTLRGPVAVSVTLPVSDVFISLEGTIRICPYRCWSAGKMKGGGMRTVTGKKEIMETVTPLFK